MLNKYIDSVLQSSPVDDSKAEEIPPGGTVCSTCGIDKAAVPWGCDGQGRVMGGIGSVPGFGWWPIKAYRPCPAAEQRGIRYTRRGQDLDQVLWGGGKK